ncbi:HAD family hydrolase [Flavobacterium columnare]|uniref:Hydrolase, haloacid dehalogenase family protein n=2 Tax=Flavobacterium columnare TaxID=996 RepID=G8X8N6_FLACA|nr:HAD family hydrolase [Flavobacterium columnare]AEW86487.1 hydrolase, haloacid dehalogenase family protein [Flavobacterium columnare ATCC 49512]AMO20407.1 HAD family hydrolase [Flavobacterium columnare]ANO49668.1 hydrolase, haloacid dehalogenase family protein [Flavobacterium columnare]APT22396.1 HAD family hydrolase [Flavobacterium columnare]AUX18368.1 HAD family hydrolase [Flavobacterium columnare]
MTSKIIAFDADDTLWHNEPYFDEAQEKFCTLFHSYASHQEILQLILNNQIKNLSLYGFGIKGFTLSMIESALQLTQNQISGNIINKILQIGKDLLLKPVELLPEVEEVLKQLKDKYKLIVATKGDLKDQHRKLHDSGLGHYFHHIEVMTDKTEIDYTKMLGRLDIQAQNFMMIGNSLKSDILPVLNIGGHGIHIPYHTTWAYERIDFEIKHKNFSAVESIKDILLLLQ